eukprot:15134455-Alexandrium_andersonii.AAC.1
MGCLWAVWIEGPAISRSSRHTLLLPGDQPRLLAGRFGAAASTRLLLSVCLLYTSPSPRD